MSDEVERTLCQLPQVHVFKIPTRKSAEGHRASDWPKDPMWTGKVKIVAIGRVAAIILQDDKNQTFAVCKVTDDAAVERTLDSGRYFVLRITNAQGRHAFIGIAFNERNDAFDFNVALSEFKNELEREDQANKASEAPVGPMQDLSLKEGEKIKIKITTKKKTTEEEEGSTSTVFQKSNVKASGGGGLLPPPGSKPGLLAPPGSAPAAPTANKTKPAPAAVNDDWGSFGSSDPFGASVAAPSRTSNNNGFDSFGSSDPFASSDPFGSAAPPAKPAKPATSKPGEANLLDL